MTCKARSPQVLHPYRGDESLPVMVMIISVPKIWFLVSVQSERFSRDGNHRYNPLGFQAMVDPMDCPCSACLRQHSPKQHGWQGSLMETMTSFFTDLKSKFWHSKLKEKRNDERTISTMIIDPNYIIYIYINYISLTIGNSLHLSQQQWSPDAQVSILSPDTWLILWKTINLHSFVHINDLRVSLRLYNPASSTPKIFKRLPVLSFSVECLASCRTMMPYKLKTKIVRPGVLQCGQGPTRNVHPGCPSECTISRISKTIQPMTTSLLENLSAGQDFHEITKKKSNYLQLHLSVFQEVVEQWQYLALFSLVTNTKLQSTNSNPATCHRRINGFLYHATVNNGC